MERNSCRICETASISDVDQCRHNRSYPKSVRCVMRRNPPASTMEILLIERAVKRMWYVDNQHIIMKLAQALKCPPIDVMNFLYKLSFSNFGKVLNLRNGERKSCRVPLATENCDIYFGIFDQYGNLRQPFRANCLDQLLEILREILTEPPDDNRGEIYSSGMFEAMGLRPRGDKGKNDCFGSCVSTGQYRCKTQRFYKIDGQYAGINAQVLVGYPADAIGEIMERLGCDDTGKRTNDQAEANYFESKFGTFRGRDSYESFDSEEYGLRKEDIYKRASGYSGRNKDSSVSNNRGYDVESGNRIGGKIMPGINGVESYGGNKRGYGVDSGNRIGDKKPPGINRVESDERNVQKNKRRDDNEKYGSPETNRIRKDGHQEIYSGKSEKKSRTDQKKGRVDIIGKQRDENQEGFSGTDHKDGDELESNQSKEGKSEGFGGQSKNRNDVYKSGGKAKQGQDIDNDRPKYTSKGGKATEGVTEQRRLSPSGKELAKVLEDINKTDRIAGNVNEIIDAVASIKKGKSVNPRSKQKDVISEISDHYRGVVTRKAGVRDPNSGANDVGNYRKSSMANVRRKERKVVNHAARLYFGEQTPVLMHEPFDQTKPWTWIKRHPHQLRIGDKGTISHSRIRRYRRESIDAKFQRSKTQMKRRFSVHTTVSRTSDMSALSHAMFGGGMYKPTTIIRMSDPIEEIKQPIVSHKHHKKA